MSFKIRCRLCGRPYITESVRRRYCDSPECHARRMEIKNARRKARRHMLARLGFPIHSKGNK